MADWRIIEGDCVEQMAAMAKASVDAVVCDPPYGLEFMGKDWDAPWKGGNAGATIRDPATERGGFQDGNGGNPYSRSRIEYGRGNRGESRAFQAWSETWATEALRVLKPGGHLLAFGGTRTYHRLVCAIEDAGFEIRDTIAWLYGSGFPKSLNVGCRCGGEATSEHDVSSLLGADVPAAGGAPGGAGPLLLEGVSQPGAPRDGPANGQPAHDRPDEPGMAGRRDAQAPEGQLRRGAARAGAGVGAPDGAVGRVRGGAPADGGGDDRASALADGGRASSGPRPVAQRAGESRALADERGAQDGRGWTHCPRCGLPTAGLGTALKPAHEPIVVARKPLTSSVAATVLAHGTGALNVDGCRIDTDAGDARGLSRPCGTHGWQQHTKGFTRSGELVTEHNPAGRWPANVVLDPEAAAMLDEQTGELHTHAGTGRSGARASSYGMEGDSERVLSEGESGGASRFFATFADHPDPTLASDLSHQSQAGDEPSVGTAGVPPMVQDGSSLTRFRYAAKASSAERNAGLDGFEARGTTADGYGSIQTPKLDRAAPRENWTPHEVRNVHPTVKPIALMRWLVRLVTPPGGLVLDPFAGSGTTGAAAMLEGFRFVGIERESEYAEIARARIAWWSQHPDGMELVKRLEAEKQHKAIMDAGQLGLFG